MGEIFWVHILQLASTVTAPVWGRIGRAASGSWKNYQVAGEYMLLLLLLLLLLMALHPSLGLATSRAFFHFLLSNALHLHPLTNLVPRARKWDLNCPCFRTSFSEASGHCLVQILLKIFTGWGCQPQTQPTILLEDHIFSVSVCTLSHIVPFQGVRHSPITLMLSPRNAPTATTSWRQGVQICWQSLLCRRAFLTT
jgi:hypothetical protein